MGLLHRDHLTSMGFSTSSIHRLQAKGVWDRPLPSVLRLWRADDPWRQMVMALNIWGGESSTISHRCAGAVWGFDLIDRGSLEISLPSPRKRPTADVIVHRRPIDGRDRARFEGLWITTPARTLFDIASCVDGSVLEVALHSAIRDGRTSLSRLRSVLERNARQHGAAVFRSVIEDIASAGGTDSVLETRFLQLIRRSSLPAPRRQYEVRDGCTFIARVDFAYPEIRLAIEIDGYRFHSSRSQLRRDHRRMNLLQRAGWLILFVSAEDLANPAVLRSRLGELIGQRSLVV